MNIRDALAALAKYETLGINGVCYRGQAAAWPLLPKAYREEFAGKAGNLLPWADSRLAQWLAESPSYIQDAGIRDCSEWDQLAIAQHYGLATRLLDWTSNPLIAIFFAAHGREDLDGELIVWKFESVVFNAVHNKPSRQEALALFRPRPLFPRLKFQQGLLSFHSSNTIVIPESQLDRITVPTASKQQLQIDLDRLGVNHETVFGTLDHLAQKINWNTTCRSRVA